MNSEAAFAADAQATLAEVLHDLPYDEVLFFEHARSDESEVNLSCVRLMLTRGWAPQSWPQRWQPDLPGKSLWMQSDTPWVNDLDAIASDPVPDSDLRVGELVSVAQLREHGIRALTGVALFDDEGRMTASLVLGSKEPSAYDTSHRDRLRSNDTSWAMQQILDRLRQRRKDLVREMRAMFVPDRSPEEIAATLVESLAAATGWDYVGIYRVEELFTMVAGCDRSPGKQLQIDPDYQQLLSDGMLGHTLRAKHCLRADDLTKEPPPYDYIRVPGFSPRSALCYPILVSGHVEWILDCASMAIGAFHGPDREMLDEVINGLQSTLNLWFETRLSRAILDSLPEAVIVTDREGTIQRSNAAAQSMFGLTAEATNRMITSLVASNDDAAMAKLRPSRPIRNEDVTVLTWTGELQAMLVSACESEGAFGRLVYKFTPKREQEWLAAMETAQTAVQGTLAHARGMLMLAGAYVDRVRVQLKSPEGIERVDQNLAKIADAIDRADLTYERLLGSMGGGEKRRQGDTAVIEGLIEWAGGALQERIRTDGGRGLPARIAGVDTHQAVNVLKTFASGMLAARREKVKSGSTPPQDKEAK